MKRNIKQIFNVFFCSVAIVGMFFLYTEYGSYQYKPLTGPKSSVEPFKDPGVHINAVVYTAKDSKEYLNRDVIADGYQPVQITIQNNSTNTYSLSTEGIPNDLGSSDSVANKVIIESIPRGVALKVASFFFWPFAIPSAIDTVRTFHSQAKLRSDLKAKVVKADDEPILPFSTVNRILLVKNEQIADHFTIYLKQSKNGMYKPFSVTVNQ